MGKEHRSLSSSLCNFLHSPVTSSLCYSPLNYLIHTLTWEFTFLNLPGKPHLGHNCISDFSAVLLPCKVFLELWLSSYQTTCYHLWEDSTLNENVRPHMMQEVPLCDAHRQQRSLLVKVCVMLSCVRCYCAEVLCIILFVSVWKKHIDIGLLRAWCLCVDKLGGSGGACGQNSMLQSTFHCILDVMLSTAQRQKMRCLWPDIIR